MDGIPHPSLLTAFPRSVAIIDRRPEYARMLATLVTEQQPTSAVRTFADPDEAERWITSAPAPILVLVDVAAGRGAAMARAVTSAAGSVSFIFFMRRLISCTRWRVLR